MTFQKILPFTAAALLFASPAVLAGHDDDDDDEQEIALSDAPPAVQSTIRRIAGANPIDEVSKENEDGQIEYEAELKIGGIKHAIAVAADGKLIEIEKKLKPAQLPAAVKSALEAKYPGAPIKGAEALYSTENLAGAPDAYEVEVKAGKKKTEVKVSPSGEILSAK